MTETLKQTFTGDSADLENKIARLEQKYLSLTEKIRGCSDTASRGAREHGDVLTGLVDRTKAQLVGLATGWIGVTQTIGAATRALEEHRATQLKIAEETTGQRKGFIADVVGAGLAMKGPEAEAFMLQQLRAGAGRQEEIMGALKGAAIGGPGATFERKTEIAAAALKLAPFLGREGVEKEAHTAALLGRALPERTPQELLSLSEFIRQKSPHAMEQFSDQQFQRTYKLATTAGIPGEKIAAMMVGMEQAGESPRAMGTMLHKLTEEIEVPKAPYGRRMTEGERITKRYAQLGKDYAARFEMLETDEKARVKILGPTEATVFANAAQRAPEMIAAGREAMASDLAGQVTQRLGQLTAGKTVETIYAGKAEAQAKILPRERQALVTAAYEDIYEEARKERGETWLESVARKPQEYLTTGFASVRHPMSFEKDYALRLWSTWGPEYAERFRTRVQGFENYPENARPEAAPGIGAAPQPTNPGGAPHPNTATLESIDGRIAELIEVQKEAHRVWQFGDPTTRRHARAEEQGLSQEVVRLRAENAALQATAARAVQGE